jgi:hypothetical protein
MDEKEFIQWIINEIRLERSHEIKQTFLRNIRDNFENAVRIIDLQIHSWVTTITRDQDGIEDVVVDDLTSLPVRIAENLKTAFAQEIKDLAA